MDRYFLLLFSLLADHSRYAPAFRGTRLRSSRGAPLHASPVSPKLLSSCKSRQRSPPFRPQAGGHGFLQKIFPALLPTRGRARTPIRGGLPFFSFPQSGREGQDIISLFPPPVADGQGLRVLFEVCVLLLYKRKSYFPSMIAAIGALFYSLSFSP